MTSEERLSMKPNSTMVYHVELGCSIQVVLKEIRNGCTYIFHGLEDKHLSIKEVEDCFEIIQL